MAFKQDHNIFVGSLIGSFKGMKLDKKDGIWSAVSKNLRKVDSLNSSLAVTAMAWGDEEQREMLIGLADQTVKVYDTEFKSFGSSISVKLGRGKICGLTRIGESLVVAVESGEVKIFAHENKAEHVIDVGGPLEKMKQCPRLLNTVAVGGKEKDLQLWDVESSKCTFAAKNVRHDNLDLRVPVWVSDIDFMPLSSKVVICSKYGHVRIYDPNGQQRRPVFNFQIPEQSLTACSVTGSGSKIIVGSGSGHMCAVDIRSKGLVCHQYKGSVGSIRAIVCHPVEDLLFSVGLDRFIKIHSVDSPKLLYKEYLKTKLNCVLVRQDFFYVHQEEKEDSDCEIVELCDEGQEFQPTNEEDIKKFQEKRDFDNLFDSMDQVVEKHKKKKCK